MKIEPLEFEKKPVMIHETYIDEDGQIRERTREIYVPTGRCLSDLKKRPDEDGPDA